MSKTRLTDAPISISQAKAWCLRRRITKWAAMHMEGVRFWSLRVTAALRKSAIRLPSKRLWVYLVRAKHLRSSGTLLCCRSSERRAAAAKAWARLAVKALCTAGKAHPVRVGLRSVARLRGFAGSLPQFVFRFCRRRVSDGLELGCFPKITLKRGKIIA